jgi:hypothetical protein
MNRGRRLARDGLRALALRLNLPFLFLLASRAFPADPQRRFVRDNRGSGMRIT